MSWNLVTSMIVNLVFLIIIFYQMNMIHVLRTENKVLMEQNEDSQEALARSNKRGNEEI